MTVLFCPFSPGQRTATESCEYITSVVIDCDWVPRMSLHSVTRLREEILDAISRARVHKLMILQVSGSVAAFRRDPPFHRACV